MHDGMLAHHAAVRVDHQRAGHVAAGPEPALDTFDEVDVLLDGCRAVLARHPAHGLVVCSTDRIPAAPDHHVTRDFTPGAEAVVEAQVSLSQEALDTFDIALPPGTLSGSGPGTFTMRFPAGEAPRFALSSGLDGVVLRIPQLGWSKAARTTGAPWMPITSWSGAAGTR